MPEGGAKWLTDRKGSLSWPERWLQKRRDSYCGAAWVGRGSRAAGQLGAFGIGGRSAQLVK